MDLTMRDIMKPIVDRVIVSEAKKSVRPARMYDGQLLIGF